jgi:protoporphyrin/coproporphyrin ferrochelatase
MKVGVLLFNLGGPETLRDVKPFLYRLFSDPEIIHVNFPRCERQSHIRSPRSGEKRRRDTTAKSGADPRSAVSPKSKRGPSKTNSSAVAGM